MAMRVLAASPSSCGKLMLAIWACVGGGYSVPPNPQHCFQLTPWLSKAFLSRKTADSVFSSLLLAASPVGGKGASFEKSRKLR